MTGIATAVFWGATVAGVVLGLASVLSVWVIEWRIARRHPDVWRIIEREDHGDG